MDSGLYDGSARTLPGALRMLPVLFFRLPVFYVYFNFQLVTVITLSSILKCMVPVSSSRFNNSDTLL